MKKKIIIDEIYPLLTSEVLDNTDVLSHIIGYRPVTKTDISRERYLVNLRLVSKVWNMVVCNIMEDEIYISYSPLYCSYSLQENIDFLTDTFGIMKNHNWYTKGLIDFLIPRLLQPYRSKEPENRVIPIHLTCAPYLEDTMNHSVCLLRNFLGMDNEGRYKNQYIKNPERKEHYNVIHPYTYKCISKACNKRVDKDKDNPFIVFHVSLDLSFNKENNNMDILYDLFRGQINPINYYNPDVNEKESFFLPKGTILIIIFTSFYISYIENPTKDIAMTENIIYNKMLNQGYNMNLLKKINKNLIIFNTKT